MRPKLKAKLHQMVKIFEKDPLQYLKKTHRDFTTEVKLAKIVLWHDYNECAL